MYNTYNYFKKKCIIPIKKDVLVIYLKKRCINHLLKKRRRCIGPLSSSLYTIKMFLN